MSYAVQLTDTAKADLMEIYRYIAVDLQSAVTAGRQLSRLEKEIASLSEMPERFRRYFGKADGRENLRIMPVDNYSVFYEPSCEENTVTVLRILYGRRDMDAQKI